MLDVVIVGGGPAGLTAACYLRRFHRACVVLDAGDSRARWIPESNNCPGFPQGVSGDGLLRRLREQAAAVDVPIEEATVDSVRRDGDGFEVRAGGRCWRGRRVILATGVSDRLPDEPWVEAAVACHALRLCSICDAYEASDQSIGVVGASDVIGNHAIFLRSYSPSVTALPLDEGDGGDAGRRSREAGVEWLSGGGRLGFDGRRCTWTVAGNEPVAFDTVYAYLGFDTCAGMAAAAGAELDGQGGIIVDAHQQTRLPGLYAIGDVVSGLNQIAVAVGHGAIAATHAHNALPFVERAGR